MIRVAVVAQIAAIRAGLSALLQGDPALAVVGQVVSLPDLKAELDPDVVILYPGVSIRGALQELSVGVDADLSSSPYALLLITDSQEDIPALAGIPLRAWGALLPDTSAEELQAAVHALAEGLVAGSPVLVQHAWANPLTLFSLREGSSAAQLTQREMEILRLLSTGLANKQIADALKISPHTVKFHIGSIYQKLGATNRAEAVRRGIQQGQLTV
ncbi:MAG TPA: response regulator transcription factor [Anaerolineaceae bacterium]